MTTKKTEEAPVVDPGPLSFRDYVGDLKSDDVVPVEIAYAQEPVTEPAKPAAKNKEN